MSNPKPQLKTLPTYTWGPCKVTARKDGRGVILVPRAIAPYVVKHKVMVIVQVIPND